jgi:hypothetical protein
MQHAIAGIYIIAGLFAAFGIVAVYQLRRIAQASETTKLIASNHRDLADTHLRFVQTVADQRRNVRDTGEE